MSDIVGVTLFPSHGKHVVVAVDRAELGVACANMRKMDMGEANALRRQHRVALIKFNVDAGHTEEEWTRYLCDILQYVCLAHVCQGKPLPIVPAPDDERCVWFQKVDTAPPSPKKQIGLTDL